MLISLYNWIYYTWFHRGCNCNIY